VIDQTANHVLPIHPKMRRHKKEKTTGQPDGDIVILRLLTLQFKQPLAQMRRIEPSFRGTATAFHGKPEPDALQVDG
jgi:hypothetical protein